MRHRVREHIALMTATARAFTGIGGILDVVGLVLLIEHGPKHASPWLWIAGGFLVIAASQVWAVQRALAQRDAALSSVQSVNQQMIHMAEGAAVSGRIQMDRIQMSTGTASAAFSPKRRWFPRLLTDEEREDLADRCEACSREVIEFLTRPEPSSPGFFAPADPNNPAHVQAAHEAQHRAQEEYETDREAYRQETEQGLQRDFVPRMRDLLNECAEAGYALDAATEAFRQGKDAQWFDRLRLAQTIGVVARRVRRRAKRL